MSKDSKVEKRFEMGYIILCHYDGVRKNDAILSKLELVYNSDRW